MKITTKELRIQPGRIIDQVSTGQEIIVTFRGKPLAKIIPFSPVPKEMGDVSMFGIWKSHDNNISVDDEVRDLREGRKF
jgi:prevent-host-death family protein